MQLVVVFFSGFEMFHDKNSFKLKKKKKVTTATGQKKLVC